MVATENGTLPITQAVQSPPMMTTETDREGQCLSREVARKWWKEEVSNHGADRLLLLCCLVSGLVDSTIYNAYGTFVCMQTGHTILVGLGGSTSDRAENPYIWAKSLISIVCFVIGALFFSRICRHLTPLRRSTLIASFTIQSVFIFLTAAIIAYGLVDGSLPRVSYGIDWNQEIPIALLSFQSAGQMVGSRTLSISELPTVVVTSVLCDIASDPNLTASLNENKQRNRRAMGFLLILVGAMAGGWISRVAGQIHSVLWIAGGIKVFIALNWVFWPGSH